MKLIIKNRKDALEARRKINEFLKCCRRDNSTVINGVQYVDLGLPSGILWAEHNAAMYIEPEYPFDPAEKTHFNYEEAVAAFGDSLPEPEHFRELQKECAWTQDLQRRGYTVSGKNGRSIFLPCTTVGENPSFLGNYLSKAVVLSRSGSWNTGCVYGLTFGSFFIDPITIQNAQRLSAVRLISKPVNE